LNISQISPRLIRRAGGGWLAVTEDSFPLRIGATGVTEAEAVQRFRVAAERWEEILTEGDPSEPGREPIC